jgi:hydroxyacylglutathione hydrolase
MEDDQPLKPANILNIVATNQGKRPLTTTNPVAKPLSVSKVMRLIEQEHVIVDARSSALFGAGHIPGAVNVQLSSDEFEQRVGWVLPDDAPIILVTDRAADAQDCIFKMAFIALDANVSGFLDGSIDAWMAAGQAVTTIPQMDVFTLKHKLAVNGLQVLDTRDQEEWDEGHISQANFMPYTSMARQLSTPSQLDKLPFAHDKHIAVTCATGKRSSTAISLMRRHGYTNLYNVTGGMEAWKDAGFEVIDMDGCVTCRTEPNDR